MNDISQVAKKLFETDEEFSRDRRAWGTFEKMPAGLQQWWVDRAANTIRTQQNIGALQN